MHWLLNCGLTLLNYPREFTALATERETELGIQLIDRVLPSYVQGPGFEFQDERGEGYLPY